MIKFLDLPRQYRSIKTEIDSAMEHVVANGLFIGGETVERFESEFANYQNVSHCIGVGNGTDALEIAIESLSIPPNSEIIVPANSFVASSEAVTRMGHTVVFADTDDETYLIDPGAIKRKITDKTAAIMPVHLYGRPAPMPQILEIARRHGLKVIEDCAQAHGAEIDGKRVGTFGDIGTFSFYPGKNLGAFGDAGAIVTNNQETATRCRMIANHGRVKKYDHEFEGRNSRLDGLQAAVLSVKLKYLDSWIERRQAVAAEYMTQLRGLPIEIPAELGPQDRHVYHLFVVRLDDRDALKVHLQKNAVQTGIHYPISLPTLDAYKDHPQRGEQFVANAQASKILSLPIGEHLSSTDVQVVCDVIGQFFSE